MPSADVSYAHVCETCTQQVSMDCNVSIMSLYRVQGANLQCMTVKQDVCEIYQKFTFHFDALLMNTIGIPQEYPKNTPA